MHRKTFRPKEGLPPLGLRRRRCYAPGKLVFTPLDTIGFPCKPSALLPIRIGYPPCRPSIPPVWQMQSARSRWMRVEKAKSGHPGLPMGMADVATVLFTQVPEIRRRRSALAGPRPLHPLRRPRLDAALCAAVPDRLQGHDARPAQELPPAQLQDAGPSRELHHRTASRPPPARSARASPPRSAWRWRSGCWPRSSASDIVDHYTYVLCSDGDLMEGISHEAIALAGHLKLNKLIFLYDDNGITIDGPISLADDVDQVARFKACGWNAKRIDGHDPEGHRRCDPPGAEIRQAVADRLQDHHRFRRPHQGRHVQGARRSARRGRTRRREESARLELRPVRNSRRRPQGLAQRWTQGQAAQQGVARAARRPSPRRSAANSSAASSTASRRKISTR